MIWWSFVFKLCNFYIQTDKKIVKERFITLALSSPEWNRSFDINQRRNWDFLYRKTQRKEARSLKSWDFFAKYVVLMKFSWFLCHENHQISLKEKTAFLVEVLLTLTTQNRPAKLYFCCNVQSQIQWRRRETLNQHIMNRRQSLIQRLSQLLRTPRPKTSWNQGTWNL